MEGRQILLIKLAGYALKTCKHALHTRTHTMRISTRARIHRIARTRRTNKYEIQDQHQKVLQNFESIQEEVRAQLTVCLENASTLREQEEYSTHKLNYQ
jgi:hypothetical protein